MPSLASLAEIGFHAKPSVVYSKVIGVAVRAKLSVTTALFQVIFFTVPCFHASPPLGLVKALAGTTGTVESMVKLLSEISLLVLFTPSLAVTRTLTV